jgi:ABC-type Fe3+ transport system permease subunit
MSDNSQAYPADQDEQNKQNKQNKQQNKWSVTLFGREIPIWVIVVVVVLVVIAWHQWSTHHKQSVGLTLSTRDNLDKIGASSTSSFGAPLSMTSSSAGIPLSTPSTEETRRQLNKLFNSF